MKISILSAPSHHKQKENLLGPRVACVCQVGSGVTGAKFPGNLETQGQHNSGYRSLVADRNTSPCPSCSQGKILKRPAVLSPLASHALLITSANRVTERSSPHT